MLVTGDEERISTQCEEHVCQPDTKVFLDTAGEFHHYYAGEVLDRSVRAAGTDNETARMKKSGVQQRENEPKKPSTERSSGHTGSTGSRGIRKGQEL